ncbi:unnamed protein product, partial [Fusarium fujikuroi]
MIASRHTTDESLCSRCKSLDLDDILSGRWTDVQCREPVAFFGKRSTILHDEDCPLCQALLSIAAGDHDTGPLRRDENFGMFAIPSQLAYRGAKQTIPFDVNLGDRVLERAKDQKDSTWLVVRIQRGPMDGPFWYNNLPRSAHYFGCLANLSDTLNGRVRLINPAKADFEAMKRWLTHCMEQHGTLCNQDSESRSLPVSIAVINCTTRDLEPLPAGAKFAALSYVWGERTSTTDSYPSMTSLPQTIEDTITVTAEVSIPFLWVDRYCVPQQDCPQKREQIQMMHKIYRQADLTIIAAAGDSSCYGLPGISTPRARAPSVDLCVGNHHLVSTGRSAKEAIRGTAWASKRASCLEGSLFLPMSRYTFTVWS